MTTFFTSDLHFGHKNIIKYSRRFLAADPDRPTKDEVRAMDELLIENWNRQVGPEDEVYNLGDVAFCTSDARALECVNRLNGKIYWVRGNHDEIADNLDLTFSSPTDCSVPYFPDLQWFYGYTVVVDGQGIVLCHYAMREWHHAPRGVWHLFGHTHGLLTPFGKSADVGVDNAHEILRASTGLAASASCAESLRPVSFAELKAYMDKLPVGPHAEFGHGFVPSNGGGV